MISIVVNGVCYNVDLVDPYRTINEGEDLAQYHKKVLVYNQLQNELKCALNSIVICEGIMSGVKFYKTLSGLGLANAKRAVDAALSHS